MDWKIKCISALMDRHVFLTPQHFNRFEQIYTSLEGNIHFSKELCKCAFLAAWDYELTSKFQASIYPLLKGRRPNQQDLVKQAKEDLTSQDPNMKIIYQMVIDFLEHPGETPSESCMLSLSPNWLPVADSALEASHIIDRL